MSAHPSHVPTTWREIEPDEIRVVPVDGYNVVTYSFGAGEDVVLLLNGGPGLSCDYVRDSHSCLIDAGYRVVAFDQLGTGRSDRPDDPALWTISRYVDEVESVRRALGLGRVHLIGQSWGGWLAIDYALTYHEALRSLVLENTSANMREGLAAVTRLRDALGPEAVAMMLMHEVEGTLDHPDYRAAVEVLNRRHICRLDVVPAPLQRSRDSMNPGPYVTMHGNNEFVSTGNLKDWNRIPDMHRIQVPVLITVGRHDVLPPSCALSMKNALPDARIEVFADSSHMPFFEEPEAFFPVLVDFLDQHRGRR